MACAFDDGNRTMDHDRTTADGAIERLRRWQHAPTAPGVFPGCRFQRAPTPMVLPRLRGGKLPTGGRHTSCQALALAAPIFAPAPRDDSRPTRAGQMRALEWFRPVEVDFYLTCATSRMIHPCHCGHSNSYDAPTTAPFHT